jgi:hypothetical protein
MLILAEMLDNRDGIGYGGTKGRHLCNAAFVGHAVKCFHCGTRSAVPHNTQETLGCLFAVKSVYLVYTQRVCYIGCMKYL